ncbi:MAG: hypothetical protein V1775_02920 [Bacteroidota bacterium]
MKLNQILSGFYHYDSEVTFIIKSFILSDWYSKKKEVKTTSSSE